VHSFIHTRIEAPIAANKRERLATGCSQHPRKADFESPIDPRRKPKPYDAAINQRCLQGKKEEI